MTRRPWIARSWPALAIACLLVATWVAYVPGLSGGFLFDDYINLDKLASPGPVDNWPAFWRYITSGTADPLGRPVALLTFLIDGRLWPADPAPFLRTNVLLHLLNGALLFALLRRLGRALDGVATPRNDAVALLAAGLWMLHPLFVSTTLYIVQREAMLPVTFTLLGLLAYVHGRALLPTHRRAALAWMCIGIAGGTALACLSKANGVLLPLLAWVIEAVVLRRTKTVRVPRWFTTLMFALPTLVVLLYIGRYVPLVFDPVEHRPWTIAQRLLTEPRVLWEYVRLLFVPRAMSTGVYNDAYVASRTLLDPGTTLAALLALLAVLGAAIALRKHAPAFAAAVLFFLVGHLLESTTIPLELYFEHRNYLPALLLFWPLSRAIVHWKVALRVRATIAIGLLLLLATTTWQRAHVWGNPERMARAWAAQNPGSSRAQATAASFESQAGDPAAAARRLRPLWDASPHDLQLALNYVNAACGTTGLSRADADRVGEAFAHATEGDQLLHRWLSKAITTVDHHECAGMDADTIERWIAAAWRNPLVAAIPGRRQDLHSLEGQVALLRHQPDAALRAFDLALDAQPSPDAAGLQAALLASAGAYPQALRHLDHYDRLRAHQVMPTGWHMQRVHEWVLARQDYWPREFRLLRAKIQVEIDREHEHKGYIAP